MLPTRPRMAVVRHSGRYRHGLFRGLMQPPMGRRRLGEAGAAIRLALPDSAAATDAGRRQPHHGTVGKALHATSSALPMGKAFPVSAATDAGRRLPHPPTEEPDISAGSGAAASAGRRSVHPPLGELRRGSRTSSETGTAGDGDGERAPSVAVHQDSGESAPRMPPPRTGRALSCDYVVTRTSDGSTWTLSIWTCMIPRGLLSHWRIPLLKPAHGLHWPLC